MELRPITQREANKFIASTHRHNQRVVGDLFRVAIVVDDQIRGVGTAARPVSRHLDDGTTVELSRVCTDGIENGCSVLYGALCRAAKALGYRKAITYTLQSEPGASLRAANFRPVACIDSHAGWSRPSKPRPVDLWGNEAAPPDPKTRWERTL